MPSSAAIVPFIILSSYTRLFLRLWLWSEPQLVNFLSFFVCLFVLKQLLTWWVSSADLNSNIESNLTKVQWLTYVYGRPAMNNGSVETDRVEAIVRTVRTHTCLQKLQYSRSWFFLPLLIHFFFSLLSHVCSLGELLSVYIPRHLRTSSLTPLSNMVSFPSMTHTLYG